MATLHLRFVSWQPQLRRYVPVPDGTEVRVMDRDVFTPDDLIAMDDTVDGRVALPLEPLDEALPDVYFLLRQPDGDTWDTRHRVAEDGTAGLIWDFAPQDLGSPEAPVVYRRSVDMHLCLRRWSEISGWVPVPPGVRVEAVEHDLLGLDEVVAQGRTDDRGRVCLQVFDPGEALPDLSFRVLDGALHGLPEPWSSQDAAELVEPGTMGFWQDLRAAGLGEPEFPLCFGIGPRGGRLVGGNRAWPVIDGVALLRELEAAIAAARHTIHVEMMLYFDDPMGRRITVALLAAADRGVTVRMLVDQGTTRTIHQLVMAERFWARNLRIMDEASREAALARYDALAPAEEARGQVDALLAPLVAHPQVQLLDSSFDRVELDPYLSEDVPEAYRQLEEGLPWLTTARVDHRKMVITDGQQAIMGGQNIGEEYLYEEPYHPDRTAEEEPWHKWHDTSVGLAGPVVRELQLLFRERWVSEGGDAFEVLGPGAEVEGHPCFPRLPPHSDNLPVRILRTTPGAQEEFHHAFLSALKAAQRQVLIQTPYLSSREVVEALKEVARRGVQVLLVLPDEHNDSVDFLYAGRLVYDELLEAGVAVYEYQKRMNHSKVAIIDDTSWIGSANLNHASFFKHYEVVAVVEDAGFTRAYEAASFAVDLSRSRRIQARDVPGLLDINAVARLYLRQVVWRLF